MNVGDRVMDRTGKYSGEGSVTKVYEIDGVLRAHVTWDSGGRQAGPSDGLEVINTKGGR